MQQTLQGERYENGTVMYMALELSKRTWKAGFAVNGTDCRIKDVKAGDIQRLLEVIATMKAKLGLAADAKVVSGYEAGRDGFWIHRLLVSHGIDNRVMDASSFEVERRARRAKSDRIDVRKLSGLLIRKENGEERAYRRVNVPEEQVEIDRDLHRERSALKSDETRLRNRLTALLVRHGIFVALKRDLGERFESLRDWQDRPLPRAVIERCQRLWAQLELVKAHIKALEKQQREAMAKDDAAAQQMRMLQVLKGLDQQIPWVLVRELFGWRKFKNGRQVGGLAGLTPTPYASGSMSREQGISKHGIARIRSLAVELAWLWVRYQPDSPLTQWFKRRYANGGKRQRRIGIVAVARKLLIALWRYLETGVLPEGALVKA